MRILVEPYWVEMIELSTTWLGWALNFLIHSTVWLGGCFLLLRWQRELAPRWQDRLWKVAIIGSLLTPLLSAIPGGPALRLSLSLPSATAYGNEAGAAGLADPAGTASLAPAANALDPDRMTAGTPGLAAGSPSADTTPDRSRWTGVVLGASGLWLLFVVIGLLRFMRKRRQLAFRLRTRRNLSGSALARRMQRLARGTRLGTVELTECPELQAPVAFGHLQPKICVPTDTERRLNRAQQTAMLGHELAHLYRRDPLWLALLQWTEALFFFQPLWRKARRAWTQAAEECCDEWAVHRTGNSRALAECLTEVAGWMLDTPREPAVAGMAQRGSGLNRRLERLLVATESQANPRSAWMSALAVVALPLLLPIVEFDRPAHADATGNAESTGGMAGSTPSITAHRDLSGNGDLSGMITRLMHQLQSELDALNEELLASSRELDSPELLARYGKQVQDFRLRAMELQDRVDRLRLFLTPPAPMLHREPAEFHRDNNVEYLR